MADTSLYPRRRYRWLILIPLLILWLVNVSRPGAQPLGCPEGCASSPLSPNRAVRVMSLNVLHGFPRFPHLRERLKHIAAEIRREEADIVCLQEVPWAPGLGDAASYLAREAGMNHVYLRANGNRWTLLFEEGEAILSRYPLQDPRFTDLSPQASLFEHRVVLSALAITPQGGLRIFSTHLTHADPLVNRAQAASLADFVRGFDTVPGIIAGDFNAREDSPQIQALLWTDTYRATHPDHPGLTCCIDDLHAGPDEALEKRIDYLFLVPGDRGTVLASSRLVVDQPFRLGDAWLWPSDHIGLLSEIVLKQ